MVILDVIIIKSLSEGAKQETLKKLKRTKLLTNDYDGVKIYKLPKVNQTTAKRSLKTKQCITKSLD